MQVDTSYYHITCIYLHINIGLSLLTVHVRYIIALLFSLPSIA